MSSSKRRDHTTLWYTLWSLVTTQRHVALLAHKRRHIISHIRITHSLLLAHPTIHHGHVILHHWLLLPIPYAATFTDPNLLLTALILEFLGNLIEYLLKMHQHGLILSE